MSKEIMEGVIELNDEEWDALIDRSARSRLGISGEEFKRRWRAKDWASFGTDCPCCVPAVAEIGMLVRACKLTPGAEEDTLGPC